VRLPIHPDLSDLDVPNDKTKLHVPVHVAVRAAARPDEMPVCRLPLEAGSKQPLARRAESYR
jgi:hypothetical protein